MVRYLISFEYEGRNFFGSQIQPDKRTVQEELNQAICTLIKNNSTKIIMAGRLDKGVSAKCHTAHFDSEQNLEASKFLYSLNAILPDDISAFKLERVELKFHAQKNAKFRHYKYIIRNSLFKPVFDKNVLFIKKPLNIDLMKKALSKILGTHDFSAFKTVSDNPSTVCEIYYADILKRPIETEAEGSYLEIDIVGNRFLYNMVRAIVGTLLMIEKDGLSPSVMEEILNSKNRALAGHNVEPYGLTLIKTGYVNPEDYIKQLKERQINEDI